MAAAAGVIVAANVSFGVPERYVSSGVVRFSPLQDVQHGGEVDAARVLAWVLARSSLWQIIESQDFMPSFQWLFCSKIPHPDRYSNPTKTVADCFRTHNRTLWC